VYVFIGFWNFGNPCIYEINIEGARLTVKSREPIKQYPFQGENIDCPVLGADSVLRRLDDDDGNRFR